MSDKITNAIDALTAARAALVECYPYATDYPADQRQALYIATDRNAARVAAVDGVISSLRDDEAAA